MSSNGKEKTLNTNKPLGRGVFMAVAMGAAFTMSTAAKADDIQQLKQDVATLQALTQSQDKTITDLEKALAIALQKTQFVTVGGKTMYIRGCNVMIQNSVNPGQAPNGLGNLIIGFNPLRNNGKDVRTGSHFLVMGTYNNFAGNGGIVAGDNNDCSAGSAILSGNNNVADGYQSVILTGGKNGAHGTYSLIGGGVGNYVWPQAEGGTILGGTHNGAAAFFATVLGGNLCGVNDKYGAVVTGYKNIADCQYGAVVTGNNNYSGGDNSNVILTGLNNFFKISPVGCAMLTGNGMGADWDNSDPNNWKPWTYRAMTEGWLVHY